VIVTPAIRLSEFQTKNRLLTKRFNKLSRREPFFFEIPFFSRGLIEGTIYKVLLSRKLREREERIGESQPFRERTYRVECFNRISSFLVLDRTTELLVELFDVFISQVCNSDVRRISVDDCSNVVHDMFYERRHFTGTWFITCQISGCDTLHFKIVDH
jgi:hypothetical protein